MTERGGRDPAEDVAEDRRREDVVEAGGVECNAEFCHQMHTFFVI